MPSGRDDVDLSSIWMFAGCSDKDLRTIRKALEVKAVAAGSVLCAQGAIGQEFFFIVAGHAVVRRNDRKVVTLGPGQYFGELALLDRRPRSATVTAESDMELLVLGQRPFNDVLKAVPTISRRLLDTMANRLREADAKAYR